MDSDFQWFFSKLSSFFYHLTVSIVVLLQKFRYDSQETITLLFTDILGLFTVLLYFVFVLEFEGDISERLGHFVYVSEGVSHFYLDVGFYHALIVGWS